MGWLSREENNSCSQCSERYKKRIAELEAKYERANAELLAIHKIACCGCGDAEPIQEGDTMTIRGVKEMAHYLNKWGDKLTARDKALKVAREALEELVKLGSGTCLCGHFESCERCSPSSSYFMMRKISSKALAKIEELTK